MFAEGANHQRGQVQAKQEDNTVRSNRPHLDQSRKNQGDYPQQNSQLPSSKRPYRSNPKIENKWMQDRNEEGRFPFKQAALRIIEGERVLLTLGRDQYYQPQGVWRVRRAVHLEGELIKYSFLIF